MSIGRVRSRGILRHKCCDLLSVVEKISPPSCTLFESAEPLFRGVPPPINNSVLQPYRTSALLLCDHRLPYIGTATSTGKGTAMDVMRYAAAACQTALPNPLSRRHMGANTTRMLAMI